MTQISKNNFSLEIMFRLSLSWLLDVTLNLINETRQVLFDANNRSALNSQQSINQLIKQSINHQSINQSVNQPIHLTWSVRLAKKQVYRYATKKKEITRAWKWRTLKATSLQIKQKRLLFKVHNLITLKEQNLALVY